MMKKKLIAGLTGLSLFTFGSAAGALVYHINDAKEAVIQEQKTQIDDRFDRMDEMIKADTSSMTQSEIERLEESVRDHVNEQMGSVYQSRLNEKSAEITAATDKAIDEAKAELDAYINEKTVK